MASYKVVNTDQLDADLNTVASAIRAKGGTSAKLSFPSGFVSAVQNIDTGGTATPTQEKTVEITKNSTVEITPDSGYALSKVTAKVAVPTPTPKTQEKTATPTTSQQTVTPDSGYDGLSKVTVNAMPTATQATPSITVSSGGLITASATQTAGYVASGTKSATKQLTTQAAKTVTPTKSAQTAAASGVYTTGAITVAAIPSNYVDTTDATAGALDIAAGKSAYVNGVKVNGSAADCRNQKLLVSPVNDPVEVYEEEWSENALEVYNDDIDTIINDKTAIRINCRDIANGIGLTPDKIVSGNTVLGVVGTGSGGGGGTEDLNDVLTEQEALIAELKEVLAEKASGGGDGGEMAGALADKSITEFISDTCTSIGEYSFRACKNLKTLIAPNAKNVETYALYQCSALKSLTLPSVTSIATNAFRELTNAEVIDFPKLTAIPANAFYGCRGLKALILRSNTMVTLANTNAFYQCYCILGTKNSGYNPDGEKIGFIYVPKALLSDDDATKDYRRQGYWSDASLVTQFRAIEDYPEICGG